MVRDSVCVPRRKGLAKYVDFYKANPQMNQKARVLVIGGSGGTGCVAVQIAKILGAHVTAICSELNLLNIVTKYANNESMHRVSV
jgi:NADPH:quinone reductase-like Zn-dependent oxidoreductase